MKRGLLALLAVVVALVTASAAGATTGPGSMLDYSESGAQIATHWTSHTSPSSPDVILSGNAVTYDGSTEVLINEWAALCPTGGGSVGVLYGITEDGSWLAATSYQQNSSWVASCAGSYVVTPTAGSHTFALAAYCMSSCSGADGYVADGEGITVQQVNGSWSGGGGSSLPTGGTAGQVLTKNSSTNGDASWSTPATGGSSTLAGLSDVSIASPAGGDVLTYNATDAKWENKPDTDSSGSSGAGSSCGTDSTNPCAVTLDAGDSTKLDYTWIGVALLFGAFLVAPITRMFNREQTGWGGGI